MSTEIKEINHSSCTINHVIDQQVRPYLDLIDNLRNVGIQKDLPIPQIAVMGDQSSGKSSVLEALSGVSFPRGTGLVTKCATELRMKKSKTKSIKISLTWDRAQPHGAGEVDDEDNLGDLIVDLTEKLLLARGPGATFEPEHSILIELQSPDVPDLTVIDLPGIVRTVTDGQSRDVIAQVDALLDKYLNQPRTIILAVIPSNVDIATVDILERANKADPEGKRTIGVLTKPDLIGSGNEEEIVSVLTNVRKPLKLGYLMVKNRDQTQINDGVTLVEARLLEEGFFRDHSDFRELDKGLFGTFNLMNMLTTVLVNCIQDMLPDMRKEVEELLQKTDYELESLGQAPPTEISEMKHEVIKKIQSVQKSLSESEKGIYNARIFVEQSEMRLLARIRHPNNGPQEIFKKEIRKLKPDTEAKEGEWGIEQLKQHIADSRGRELPGLVNSELVTMLMKRCIKSWESPSAKYIQGVRQILVQVCEGIVKFNVLHYRSMENLFKQQISDIIDKRVVDVKDSVDFKHTAESLPFTVNHYFMDTYNKIKQGNLQKAFDSLPDASNCTNCGVSRQQKTVTVESAMALFTSMHSIGGKSNETQEAEDLQALLLAYWKTATKRFIDDIFMEVDRVLVRGLTEEASARLLDMVENEDIVEKCFMQDHITTQRRKKLNAMQERLLNARKILLFEG